MGAKGKADYQRYRLLADERNLSDYRVAKEVGIAQETLSSWKNGKYIPKREKLELIADYFDVDVDFFINDDSVIERFAANNIAPVVTKFQELFEVSAGQGRTCSCPDTYSQQDGQLAKVVGDSMLPTLQDGDVVRIIATTKVEPSDIALVKINGDENTLKHCEVTSDGLWVRGENKDVFTDRFFTMEECLTIPVQIVGKAVEIVLRKL